MNVGEQILVEGPAFNPSGDIRRSGIAGLRAYSLEPYFCLSFFFFLIFLGLYPQQTEVPRLGV